jgi:hypothetical protein
MGGGKWRPPAAMKEDGYVRVVPLLSTDGQTPATTIRNVHFQNGGE